MTRYVLTLILLLAAAAAPADDERPLALHKLEVELEKETAARMAPLDAKYRQALDKLLAEFTGSGDLESLLSVKAEIVRLENARSAPPAAPGAPAPPPKETAPKPVPRPSATGTYTLRPAGATLGGSVRFDAGLGLLVGWKGAGSARWSLAGIAPGEYRIRLDYHAGPFAGGRIKRVVGTAEKEFAISGSGKWDDPKTLDLGTAMLAADSGIELAILEARTVGVMELRALVLTPQKPAPDG